MPFETIEEEVQDDMLHVAADMDVAETMSKRMVEIMTVVTRSWYAKYVTKSDTQLTNAGTTLISYTQLMTIELLPTPRLNPTTLTVTSMWTQAQLIILQNSLTS